MHYSNSEKLANVIMTGATLGRLYLANKLCQKLKQKESIAGVTGAIIATDILDGVISRRLNVDGPSRRIADGAVDMLTIGSALINGASRKPQLKKYANALLVRESLVSAGSIRHYFQTGELARGGDIHKASSLSIAAFAIAATGDNEFAAHATGAAAVFINSALALDYVSMWHGPMANTNNGVESQETTGYVG